MATDGQQQCFYPDGSRARNDRPCGDGTADSACCAPGQICLDNNYCLNVGIDPPFTLARGSCTDQAWQSGKCPGRCRDCESPRRRAKILTDVLMQQRGKVHRDGGCAIVLQYFDSKSRESQYCCNSLVSGSEPGIAQCFQDEPEFVLGRGNIVPGKLLLENLTTATTTPGDNPQPTPPGVDTNAASAVCSSAAGGNRSSATQVGVGVGVPLGVLAIASILWALWERSKRRKMTVAGPAATHQGSYGFVQDKPPAHSYQELATPPTELEGRTPRHELAYQHRQ